MMADELPAGMLMSAFNVSTPVPVVICPPRITSVVATVWFWFARSSQPEGVTVISARDLSRGLQPHDIREQAAVGVAGGEPGGDGDRGRDAREHDACLR